MSLLSGMGLTDWLTLTELLSGMAQGRNQSQLQNEGLGTQQAFGVNADQLNRDKFALAAPGQRLRDSLTAGYYKNYQPVTAGSGIDPASGKKVVHWQGGTNNPNIVGDDQRQLADQIAHQELIDQMSGTDRKPIQQPPAIGKSDAASKILSAGSLASTGGSILSLLGLIPGRGGSPTSGGGGSWNGGLGHFDSDGNWVTETPNNFADPSQPFGGLFGGGGGFTGNDPNHD